MATERFEALEQSFQLSTRLFKVASPYLCNFFPRRILLDYGRSAYMDEDGSYGMEPIRRLLFDEDKV